MACGQAMRCAHCAASALGTQSLRSAPLLFQLPCPTLNLAPPQTQGSFAFLLVRELGGNELLMGLMLVFSICTEAPAFQFQSALLARVPVPVVMHASMVLLALRLGCYALLPRAPTVWAVLPIELLHGAVHYGVVARVHQVHTRGEWGVLDLQEASANQQGRRC
jgi:hypothetical protein